MKLAILRPVLAVSLLALLGSGCSVLSKTHTHTDSAKVPEAGPVSPNAKTTVVAPVAPAAKPAVAAVAKPAPQAQAPKLTVAAAPQSVVKQPAHQGYQQQQPQTNGYASTGQNQWPSETTISPYPAPDASAQSQTVSAQQAMTQQANTGTYYDSGNGTQASANAQVPASGSNGYDFYDQTATNNTTKQLHDTYRQYQQSTGTGQTYAGQGQAYAPQTTAMSSAGGSAIQLFATSSNSKASRVAGDAQSVGLQAVVDQVNGLYKVRVPFSSDQEARGNLMRVRQLSGEMGAFVTQR